MQSSDWRHFDDDKASIEQGVRDGKRVVLPFVHLTLSDLPAEQVQCASIWAANETPAPPLRSGAVKFTVTIESASLMSLRISIRMPPRP